MTFRPDISRMFWFYNRTSGKNFGDWIGPYLYRIRRGHMPVYTTDLSFCTSDVLFTCGSIFHNITEDDRAIVWGSGVIEHGSKFKKPREIISVRGPLSKDACVAQGYDCPEIYGDPGLLLPTFYSPTRSAERWALGIVPHFVDLKGISDMFKLSDEVKIIDVRRDVEDVVDDIVACDAIMATSLHGVIVALAYGIPVFWARYSEKIIGGNFKFNDFYLGVGCEMAPSPYLLVEKMDTGVLIERALSAPTLPKSFDSQYMLAQCPF